MLAGQRQGDRCVLQEGAAVVRGMEKPCSDSERLQHRSDSISLTLALCDSTSNSSLQCSTS